MEKAETKIDWSILKGSVIVFCTCVVLCGALIGSSYYFNSKLSKELKQNKNIFQATSRKYLDVDQEEKLLHNYYPKFVKLYNSGVIGREKRLNWIEALRQSGEVVKIPELKYSINSQEEYIPEYEVNYNGYLLYASSMELNIGLLHEGDLFKLLNHINDTAEGLYTIEECNFKLNGKQIIFEKNHTNIATSCLLSWITIDLESGKRIEI